jgi:hypothetical protein
MNLETRRPRGRPSNRWQYEVREDGRMVGGDEWKEKVYNGEEWKKLLRTARNCRILHMSMEKNSNGQWRTPVEDRGQRNRVLLNLQMSETRILIRLL